METKHRRFGQLSVLFIMSLLVIVHAADVSENDILTAARKWIADNAVFRAELPNAIPEKAAQLTDGEGKAMPLWRVDLQPTGYLVMSADDTLPPVVTFNTKGSFETPADHPLPALLKRQGEIFQTELGKPQTRGNDYATENQARWHALLKHTRGDPVTPSEIITPPMLTTEWHQDTPYDFFCPSGDSYAEHAAAGCVPLAICQVLKYHEWPPAGVSVNLFSNEDNQGDIQCITQADITVPYNWNMMKDRYDATAERNHGAAEHAVARLVMEMGTFSMVDYGFWGTSASVGQFFVNFDYLLRYSDSAQHGVTLSVGEFAVDQATLFSRIRADMMAGRPTLMGIPTHEFVADGLATMNGQDYYHFNYGWGGKTNGWFLLTDGVWNSIVEDAVTNIQPSPIAVFKPMSCEQSSSFTLAWDFPKRLTAEAFRLTKTTGTGGHEIISSSISGTARSYMLTGQSGTATYTLEAKVGGSWQDASDGVTVTVKAVPTPMLELATDKILKCITGTEVTTTITANNTLKGIQVRTSRPDILSYSYDSYSNIVISGSGTSRNVKLTPVKNMFGNLLLYVTARDTAGNIVKQTIPMVVKEDAPLEWYTVKDEAMGAAMESGKLVLLVAGPDDYYYTNTFRNTICEISDIKAELLGNYTLWYCNSTQSSEYLPYTSRLGSVSPLIAIINPTNQNTRLRAHDGPITANETRQLLNCYMPYFSLNNDESYELGTTQTLELSDLRDDAVVYYRLDSATPTTSDTPYTEPLSLSATTTISARTFKNGEPVSDTVTKTYTFLEKVATPVLNKAENDYFFDSFVVTATCATPGVTIRYTTDATIPTASSAVMPEEGVTVRTYSVICVKAFKEGMKDSDYAYTHLDVVRDLDGAQNVVTGNVRVGTPSMSTAWYLQRNTYNSAPTALQSADIPADGSTVMVAKVTGGGTLSFNWRNTTDMLNEDHLFVSIDGVLQDVLYGGDAWANRTFLITEDGDHYVRWSYAKTGSYSGNGGHAWVDDIIWTENTLESITIEGNGAIAINGSEAYTCTAMWSNGMTSVVKPTWSVTPTTYATVDANGVVTNKNTTDKTVTLKASYTYNGVTKTASKTITLVSRLISIAISGDSTIATAGTATYTCTATWGNGTTTTITPTTWTVTSASSYASVDANGVVTNKNLMTTDMTVTLKAVYTMAGMTQEATKTIIVAKKTIVSVAITGDETIPSGGSATYNCTVTWSYGPASKALSPEWSLSSTSYASVDAKGVVTNENATGRDLTVRLNVSCTVNGVTKTATKSITLPKKTVVSVSITGDASIPAGGMATYRCTVKWSYGPDSTVPSPIWTLKSTSFATVDENGVVTNKNKTMNDHLVQLNALCTIDSRHKLVFKSIMMAGGVTQTLTLQPGWNWVSFYLLPSNRMVGNVLGTAGFTANDIVQTNGDSSRFIGSGWLPLSIEFGKLYQIYVDKAVTVEIPGAQSGQTTVPLQSGWNWIGNPTAREIMLSDVSHSDGWVAGDRIQTAGGESAIYTADGNWIPADELSLEPGKGYQIYASNAGTLSFTSLYVVVDLSGGPNASNYPVRYTNTAPDLNDDTCRTTELWLRRIPAGTFMMGSPQDEIGRYDNETQHEVTLTQDYYIGVFECTQKQWELVMGDKPSFFNNADYYATRPVELVSYNMVRCMGEQDEVVDWPTYGHTVGSRSFMGVLKAKTGLTFDLPTEAQWEYACRAGTTTALNSEMNLTSTGQDAAMDEVGRYYFNGGKETTQDCTTDNGTAKVGSYLPNVWGLYDMHGNVCELCLDWNNTDNDGTAAVVDPLGPISGSYRIVRDGCWSNMASSCRAACRRGNYASSPSQAAGFRIVFLP